MEVVAMLGGLAAVLTVFGIFVSALGNSDPLGDMSRYLFPNVGKKEYLPPSRNHYSPARDWKLTVMDAFLSAGDRFMGLLFKWMTPGYIPVQTRLAIEAPPDLRGFTELVARQVSYRERETWVQFEYSFSERYDLVAWIELEDPVVLKAGQVHTARIRLRSRHKGVLWQGSVSLPYRSDSAERPWKDPLFAFRVADCILDAGVLAARNRSESAQNMASAATA